MRVPCIWFVGWYGRVWAVPGDTSTGRGPWVAQVPLLHEAALCVEIGARAYDSLECPWPAHPTK